MSFDYDVIVIGAGHAGIEASAVASQRGCRVCLITKNQNNIGELSCNPSIGGVGKGTIVKEVCALGGVMPRVTDMSSIHFKILNSSKGPAVWGYRAQVDRIAYKKAMMDILQEYNMDILYAEVIDIIYDENNVYINGVIIETDSGDLRKISCKSIVLSSGTFLNGTIHIGNVKKEGGRYDEYSSKKLPQFFKKMNFKIGRLKTGTPARIIRDSINYSKLEEQRGDDCNRRFSSVLPRYKQKQISCHITYTNQETHEIIKNNIHKSAMYSGNISGIGPRYCPSIEDKINRFQRDRHQVFLEPEGIDNDTVYPNGISTSLPEDIQDRFIRSIEGLENCKIKRYGYAIEYDFICPTELRYTLETKKIRGLFLAGQINGTTGYEEAAGQGIIAGINAALYSLEGIDYKEFILSRGDAYIGVMIDDLIRHGVSEPYRMMTSRAEFRMQLRSDNCERRLSELAIERGFLTKERRQVFYKRKRDFEKLVLTMKNTKITNDIISFLDDVKNINITDKRGKSIWEIVGIPQINWKQIILAVEKITGESYCENIKEEAYIESMYENYTKRQEAEINALRSDINIKIHDCFDFSTIPSLSSEVVSRLNKFKPKSYAEIKTLEGITPAALFIIRIYLEKDRCTMSP